MRKIGKNLKRGDSAGKARDIVTRRKTDGAGDNPNSRQVGGDHYKGKTVQPWDFIAANELGFFEGNVVKYVTRWKDKGGVQDLHKARHYLDKLIEVVGDASP